MSHVAPDSGVRGILSHGFFTGYQIVYIGNTLFGSGKCSFTSYLSRVSESLFDAHFLRKIYTIRWKKKSTRRQTRSICFCQLDIIWLLPHEGILTPGLSIASRELHWTPRRPILATGFVTWRPKSYNSLEGHCLNFGRLLDIYDKPRECLRNISRQGEVGSSLDLSPAAVGSSLLARGFAFSINSAAGPCLAKSQRREAATGSPNTLRTSSPKELLLLQSSGSVDTIHTLTQNHTSSVPRPENLPRANSSPQAYRLSR